MFLTDGTRDVSGIKRRVYWMADSAVLRSWAGKGAAHLTALSARRSVAVDDSSTFRSSIANSCDGAHGAGAAFAMRLLVRFADAVDARAFLDVEAAHVDGCLYHGRASLDFAERMIELGGKVRVPTTLNVGSVDLIHPELFRGTKEHAENGARLMRRACRARLRAHLHLRALPDAVAPALRRADRLGRIERDRLRQFGDRRAHQSLWRFYRPLLRDDRPRARLWLAPDGKPSARAIVEIVSIPEDWDNEQLAVAVGHAIGRRCGGLVPAIVGLPADMSEDDLKALGAAAASSGAVALFHVVGVTPEAPDLETACGGLTPELRLQLTAEDLREAARSLSNVAEGAPLGAVSLGTPHFSIEQFARLMPLIDGERPLVDIFINCSRATLDEVRMRGWEKPLRAARVTLVADTCVYVSALMKPDVGTIMTNSGKCAYYAPGNLGVEVAYGSLAECVASARAGKVVRL